MNWRQEWKWLAVMVGGFLAVFYLPVGSARFDGAVLESFHLVKWYAREHVLLCLIPGTVHCRRHRGLRQPGGRHEVPGSDRPQGARLRRGVGLGHGPRRVLVHGAPPVRGDLPHGGGHRSGLDVPVRRARHQRPGDHPDGTRHRARDGHRPRRRRHRLQRRHRPADAHPVQARRAGQGCRADTPAAADHHAPAAGRTRCTSRRWSACWCSPTGARPTRPTGFWRDVYEARWTITALFGLGFGTMLAMWFGLPWWKVAAGVVATAAAALVATGNAAGAVWRRRRGPLGRHRHARRRAERVVRGHVGVRQADPAAAAARRAAGRLAARPRGARRTHPVGVGQPRGGRQLDWAPTCLPPSRARSCTSPRSPKCPSCRA